MFVFTKIEKFFRFPEKHLIMDTFFPVTVYGYFMFTLIMFNLLYQLLCYNAK